MNDCPHYNTTRSESLTNIERCTGCGALLTNNGVIET